MTALFRRRMARPVIGLTLAALAVTTVCGAGPAQAGAEPLQIGIGADVDTLDPHRATSVQAGAVLLNLCEGLLTRNASGALIPGVAERWSVSEDGRTIVFHLRADARWSDGTDVTAHDFVRGWRRAVDPATASGMAESFLAVENAPDILAGRMAPEELGVDAVDDRTLTVRLSRPSPDFLIEAGLFVTLPLHGDSFARHGAAFTRPGNFVCNGAYALTEHQPNSHYRLERNPHFHAAEEVATGTAILRIVESAETELNLFRTGELHATSTIPFTKTRWARETLPESLRVHPYTALTLLRVNRQREPWAGNRALREALYLAVDRDALVQVGGGISSPAYGLVPPGLEGWTAADFPAAGMSREQRIAAARAKLAEAGHAPGTLPPIELLHVNVENAKQLAIAIAAMWKQVLGVEVVLTTQEPRVVAARYRAGDFPDWVLAGAVAQKPSDALDIARDRSAGGRIHDPELAGLITGAREAPSADRQVILLRHAEKVAVRDVAVIPLTFNASRRLVSPRLLGWEDNVLDLHPVRFLHLSTE